MKIVSLLQLRRDQKKESFFFLASFLRGVSPRVKNSSLVPSSKKFSGLRKGISNFENLDKDEREENYKYFFKSFLVISAALKIEWIVPFGKSLV